MAYKNKTYAARESFLRISQKRKGLQFIYLLTSEKGIMNV